MTTGTTARGGFAAFGLRAEAEPLQPGLHVVATPIGNLKDISLRALATLAAADAILAEDTRVTKVLLAHYGVSTPLVAYHDHNAEEMRPKVMARLQRGEALAWCRTRARRWSPTRATGWSRTRPPPAMR